MLDGLICAPSEGATITKENATWQQEPFDGGFTASVFVSQDPVAIDSVGADFLSNEPTVLQYNRAAAMQHTPVRQKHEKAMLTPGASMAFLRRQLRQRPVPVRAYRPKCKEKRK